MPRFTLRVYKDSDYESVKRILVQGEMFDRVWDRRSNLRKKIKQNPGSIIVAIQNGKVVGCVYTISDGWEGFIFRLAVLKPYRKHGLGSTLLNRAELELKKLGIRETMLFVDSRKLGLQRYYKKRGYKNSSRTFKAMWKEL